MLKKISILHLVLIALLFSSCKQNTKGKDSDQTEVKEKTENLTENKKLNTNYNEHTVNDALAAKVKDYLTSQYLSEADARAITEDQRKFQLYETDLNTDGKNEILVNFITPYFCGSGGCTMLLLDADLKLITEFSVMSAPVYVEDTVKNDWNVLALKSEGDFKELVFKDDSYPTNPSMLEKSDSEPSDNSEILFKENTAKTYTF